MGCLTFFKVETRTWTNLFGLNGRLKLDVLILFVVLQVNVSELGLVTPAGKVVWGK